MRPKKLKWKKELLDLSFLLPALLLFLFIIIVPLISGVRFTFTDWDGMSPVQNFVGLKNYRTVFTDKDLLEPIRNTVLFTVVTVVAINVIGLALAMMVVREFRGVNVVKSIIFIPLVVSLVLVSQMWMYVYSDFFGMLGIDSPLIHKETAMLGLCLMSIWREMGLAMIIYLAAACLFLILLDPVFVTAAVVEALVWMYYRRMSEKYFGGITGDLAGWFVSVGEAAGMIWLALCGLGMEKFL